MASKEHNRAKRAPSEKGNEQSRTATGELPSDALNQDRRSFLKKTFATSAFLGGASVIGASLSGCARPAPFPADETYRYPLDDPENIIHSVCLQCHTDCPIKCKLWRISDKEAVLAKIDGNPYSPQTQLESVPYEAPLSFGARFDGHICPKGQAGIQTLYDPYRIRKVLKRAGPRGSNRWVTVSLDQAVEEIVRGGNLFGEGPVPGLQETFAVRDPKALGEMASLAKTYLKAYKASGYSMRAGDYFEGRAAPKMRRLWHMHRDKFMNSDHPDLGPKNNGFVFMAGRIEHGRKEFMKRFTRASFGSVNCFEHTTICEQSHHIAHKEVTNNYKAGKWSGGKDHLKPDLYRPRYVMFFGTGCFEANFGPPLLSALYSGARARGGFHAVVVDPRKSHTAMQADEWIPIRPGGDGAMAMGMIRVILDEGLYNETYLRCCNAETGKRFNRGNPSFTWATFLVKLEKGRPVRYLRWADVLRSRGEKAGPKDEHRFVVSLAGEAGEGAPTAVGGGRRWRLAPLCGDDRESAFADLPALTAQRAGLRLPDGTEAKTSFDLLWDRAREHDLAFYSRVSGVEPRTIRRLARELAANRPTCCVEFYRGAVKHTDGYYQAQALISLNILMGSCNQEGGWTAGAGHWHEDGGKDLNLFHGIEKDFPGALKAWGVCNNREKSAYENSSLFQSPNGGKSWRPADRPWYPYTSNLYQEIIPSAGDGYPYGITHLFLHKGTPVFSSPAGHLQIETLQNPKKIPVFIACDIVIGETSMYADYIIPDVAIWERWGTPHVTPACLSKMSKVRQPVVAHATEPVVVDGHEMPLCMESFLIAMGKRLGCPGFGRNAFHKPRPKNGRDPEIPAGAIEAIDLSLDHPEDFYFKLILNIAAGDYSKEMKGPEEGLCLKSTPEELKSFARARRHLPPSIFDLERWKNKVGEGLWPHFVYVLNRGGRFENTAVWYDPEDETKKGYRWYGGKYAYLAENKKEKRYKGNHVAHPFHNPLRLFIEHVAAGRDSTVSGKYFDGLPRCSGRPLDSRDQPLQQQGYPLKLITYKTIWGGQSRTVPPDLWLREIEPENGLLLHPEDARALSVRQGDRVRIVSAGNPEGKVRLLDGEGRTLDLVTKVKLTEGIRPGTVGVSWHFGHWAYGSQTVVVDGATVLGDPDRKTGMNPNPVLLADPYLKDVALTDKIGGSASFYDTFVRLIKV